MSETAVGTGGQVTLLIVDDEPIFAQLIPLLLDSSGYAFEFAENGRDGLEKVNSFPGTYDAIVLDLNMPVMGGFEFLESLREIPSYNNVPVVIQTADHSGSTAEKAMQLGAYYFVNKPYEHGYFVEVIHSVVAQSLGQKEITRSMERFSLMASLLETGCFKFRTLEHVTSLAVTLSHCCPKPSRSLIGITELMTNAVEHGNLGISGSLKTRLIEQDELAEEIDRRLELPEQQERWATVEVRRTDAALTFTIRDCGKGFDWRQQTVSLKEKLFEQSGRGIALASMLSFDALEFKGVGNEVVATINLPSDAPAQKPDPTPFDPDQNKGSKETERQLQQFHTRYGLKTTGELFQPDGGGGDSWGMRSLNDHRAALYLIDFSGKGAEAVKGVNFFRNSFAAIPPEVCEPEDVLAYINNPLLSEFSRSQYATMLYCLLDLKNNVMRYATAGAPLPVILRPSTGEGISCNAKGLPLGMMEDMQYQSSEQDFLPGDCLILYSDGIIERPDRTGEIIGRAGAGEFFQTVLESPTQIPDAATLLARIRHRLGSDYQDDATLVCCHRA